SSASLAQAGSLVPVSAAGRSRSTSSPNVGVRAVYMSGYTDDALVHHGVLDSGTRIRPKAVQRGGAATKIRPRVRHASALTATETVLASFQSGAEAPRQPALATPTPFQRSR